MQRIMRILLPIITITSILMVGYVDNTTKNTDITEQEVGLGYLAEDLYNLGTDEPARDITCNVTTDSSKSILIVEKWTGENMVISIPKNNTIALFANGEFLRQYEFTYTKDNSNAKLDDVTLLPDRILLNVPGGAIYEFGYDGKLLYSLRINGLTHQTEQLENGNYLIVRSRFDQVLEITREGEIVWQWNALEGILPYSNDNFSALDEISFADAMVSIYSNYKQQLIGNNDRWEWTHVNSVQKLDNGDYLINLRNQDIVIKVNPEGKVVWSFGALLLKHPHHPRILNNGNLLVYDNGNGRVVEFDTHNQQIVWEYTGLISPVLGWCEKLWNGNYLFPDTCNGRVLEVDADGNIVKLIGFDTTDMVIFERQIYQCKGYGIETLDWIGK